MSLNAKAYFSIFIAIVLLGFLFGKELLFKQPSTELLFWHYWTGEEKTPLEDLVQKFNSQETDFQVKLLSVSSPRKKYLMAINSGTPPDLIHLDSDMVIDLGLRNALLPLSVKENHFENIFLEMLNIEGKQLALPLLPSLEAMHINLDKVGAAPESLEEIVELAKTYNREDFFVWHPKWPSWTGRFLPIVFGGRWAKKVDGKWQPTANSPENIEAWTWMQENFTGKLYQESEKTLGTMVSAYQSADNPFYAGKIGLENNGIWEKKLAGIYAPDLKIKIAPFPSQIQSHSGGSSYPSYVSADAIAIPKGSKKQKQAQKFINWLSQQNNLERLALAQEKFTPLKKHSKDFFAKHPNKDIKVFVDLAASPNAAYFPQLPYIQKYKREIKLAYDKVFRKELSAKQALINLQEKLEISSKPCFN